MTWSSTFPVGTLSVKDNESIGQRNTQYIQDKMQLDHFWNEDGTKDGHHDLLHMPKQDSDPAVVILNGALYLKDTVEDRTEGFYRNSQGIYQFIPSFKTGGPIPLTSTVTYVGVVSVPANVYGEIFMYNTLKTEIQHGTFVSDATKVNTFATVTKIKDNTNGRSRLLEFGNGVDALLFNIQARLTSGTSGNWFYRVVYRDL